jgi:hypothetical protein
MFQTIMPPLGKHVEDGRERSNPELLDALAAE